VLLQPRSMLIAAPALTYRVCARRAYRKQNGGPTDLFPRFVLEYG
jgi:hypothetical protein